jgi:hypothetical protein
MVRVSEKLPAGVEMTVPIEKRRPMRPVQVWLVVRQVVLAYPKRMSGTHAEPVHIERVVALSEVSPTQTGEANRPDSRPMWSPTWLSVTVRVVPEAFLNVQLLPV